MGAFADRLRLSAPGDGARLLPLPGKSSPVAVSVDTMVEGIHFDDRTGAEDLGYKALAVNLSDMAAMGAMPLGASLSLSAETSRLGAPWLEDFARGLLGLADAHRLVWRGGLGRIGPLVVTVEIFGAWPGPSPAPSPDPSSTLPPCGPALTRSGARPGDDIYVSGTLGDAGACLQCDLGSLEPGQRQFLRRRLFRPTARVGLGSALNGLATAAIDISDGLSADLGHIVHASGVNALVHGDRLPLSEALLACAGPERALALALAAGDDYELAFTAPAHQRAGVAQSARTAQCPVTRIGRVLASRGGTSSVRWLDAGGREFQPPSAYSHFRADDDGSPDVVHSRASPRPPVGSGR